MSNLPTSATIDDRKARTATLFWREFSSPSSRPKYVFGRNVYTADLVAKCHVDAIVDDFAKDADFHGVPIIRSDSMTRDGMVIAAAGGRPLTVRNRLNALGVEHIDYFQLRRYANPTLKDIVFNEGFEAHYLAHQDRFARIHARLADATSRETFRKLVDFRINYDLDILEGFTERQREQYFEPFLDLHPGGETFVDVGCFDGFTSLEFARHCPGYAAIHAFEPDPMNRVVCEERLAPRRDVTLWPVGLSDAKATLSFSANGSASGVTQDGDMTIDVERLDDLAIREPTLIKMDTEGSEEPALRGASATIARHSPRLAISGYHRVEDFWRLPEIVLDINPDYEIYMRHYTESTYETVIFFVPTRPGTQVR